MDKPLDVAQFCPECGTVLNWTRTKEHTEARPSYNARCSCFWEVFDMATPARELTATEKLLFGRIAELEATLANERGEGEPPVEGWRYDGRCDNGRPGVWECVERELIVTRPLPPAVGWRYARRGGVQVWGQALTARDAMRAASGVPDGN
jgi:hypothetical protein